MPSRLLFDLGGTVNAQGSATLAGGAGQQQPASSPTQGQVTASLASGTGTWGVEITRGQGTTGTLIGTGQGASIQQSFILLPGELIQVAVTGATSGVGIIGSVMGTQNLNQNQLPPMYSAGLQTNAVDATITGPVPYPVSDGGLAGSVAQQISVLELFSSTPLPGGTTTISVGAGTGTPYPAQVGSWELQIVGMAGYYHTAFTGVRIYWQGLDGSGNVIYSRQRDSSVLIYGSLTATGDVDAPALSWQITLPNPAPAGSVARLFFSATELPDTFYDSAIYGPVFTDFNAQPGGMDGTLVSISNLVIAGGGNSGFTMPTYRGPAQLGFYSTQAAHLFIRESDYTNTLIRQSTNIPISASGTNQLLTLIYLPGTCDAVFINNDDASASTTIFGEIRAVQDLV